MVTKEQLSDQINEILDTDLDFEQMPKEDLELFHELLDEGALLQPQMKHLVKEHGKGKLEEQVDEWYPGKYARLVL